jgi:hypothetical protein
VDGIRHIGAIEGLTKLAARSFILVFVEAPWENRVSWRGIAADELRRADAHPNEAEVDDVRLAADVVVMNDGPIEQTVVQVLGVLSAASFNPSKR